MKCVSCGGEFSELMKDRQTFEEAVESAEKFARHFERGSDSDSIESEYE